MKNPFLKILFLPFSLIFGILTAIRNFFYDKNIIKSSNFDIPTISVGNLSVGGTGKTPHVEYLIELLQPYINLATLSRGYKRESRGFLPVEINHDAVIVGDEPLQYKRKYQDVFVTVSESRANGIHKITGQRPDIQAIILDDAFQHRAITPYINLLLTEYSQPYYKDFLLPSGRLREWKTGTDRASAIVVTKCPPNMSETEKSQIIAKLNPLPEQPVFFSYYDYPRAPYYIFNGSQAINLDANLDVLLVCAIARADYLVESLKEKVGSLTVMEFDDHHFFTESDVAEVHNAFKKIDSKNKIIVTTEKDAVRLQLHLEYLRQHQIPIFCLPAKVNFLFGEKEKFDNYVREKLLDFRA